MKKFITKILTILILITPIKQTNAAVAGLASLAGFNPAPLALAALASPVVGAVSLAITSVRNDGDNADIGRSAHWGFFIGGLIGLVILDEDSRRIEFTKIDDKRAKRLNISLHELEIYNNEIDEVNIVFQEVTTYLSEESTINDSREVWAQMKDLISLESYKVMQRIAQINN